MTKSSSYIAQPRAKINFAEVMGAGKRDPKNLFPLRLHLIMRSSGHRPAILDSSNAKEPIGQFFPGFKKCQGVATTGVPHIVTHRSSPLVGGCEERDRKCLRTLHS